MNVILPLLMSRYFNRLPKKEVFNSTVFFYLRGKVFKNYNAKLLKHKFSY